MQLVILLSSSISPIWSKLRRGIQLSPGGSRFHLGSPAKAEPGPKQNCSPPEFHVKRPHLTQKFTFTERKWSSSKYQKFQSISGVFPQVPYLDTFHLYCFQKVNKISSQVVAIVSKNFNCMEFQGLHTNLDLEFETVWLDFRYTIYSNIHFYLPKSHGNFCASSTFIRVTDLDLMTVGKGDAVAHWIHTQHFHKLQML